MRSAVVAAVAALLIVSLAAGFVSLAAGSVGVRNAMGAHYELDKKSYAPGDSGRLLLVVSNEEDADVDIYGAQMNITGIGFFETSGPDMSCPVWSTDVYEGGHACLLRRGTPLNVTVPFQIPADAQSREYAYTWGVEEGRGQLGSVLWPTGSGTFWVVRPGETPKPIERSQADQLSSNLQLLALIGIPLLAVAYPLIKWKSKLAARFVVAGIAILTVLSMDSLGPFILIPIAVVAFLAAVYRFAGWLLNRKKPRASSGATELSAGAKKARRVAKWIAILALLAAVGLIAAAAYAAAPTGAMISPVPNTPLYGYLTEVWAWYDACLLLIVFALSAYYVAGGVKAKPARVKLFGSRPGTRAASRPPPAPSASAEQPARSGPKFCRACGARLAQNAAFCIECGVDV